MVVKVQSQRMRAGAREQETTEIAEKESRQTAAEDVPQKVLLSLLFLDLEKNHFSLFVSVKFRLL